MRTVVFGECMLELTGSLAGGGALRLGGDAYNTAVHMSRLGLQVDLATAVGDDVWSDDMLAAWADEGVGTRLALRASGLSPGLYAIRTDAGGERSFTYWRDRSAARAFFRTPGVEEVLARMGEADLLHVTGIGLSLFDRDGREALRAAAASVRSRGGAVSFDPNYRPRGWASASDAADAFARFAGAVTIALPSLEDARLAHGDATAEQAAARWRDAGCGEVVVKCGPDGSLVCAGAETWRVAAVPAATVVDTTGAGDAFDAGYLAARIGGRSPAEAAAAGAALATEVVRWPGALPPAEATREAGRASEPLDPSLSDRSAVVAGGPPAPAPR